MQTQHQQKGAALLATLLVIMTIALGYLTHAISSLNQSLERQALSSERLAVAKDALLGYMLVSEDDGRLPLPDMGLKTPPHTEGVAANNFTGNNADAVLIGRLPWKSIGSGPIFDESNECLWYAVAGAWKKSNITIPTFNWDTLGDFELFVPDGQGNTTPQSDNPHQNRPVALIFAPGPPLAGQDRTPSTQTGEIISKCGGNYRTINYLDPSSALVAFDGRATPLLTGTPPEGRESDYSNDSNNALGSITPDKPKSIL